MSTGRVILIIVICGLCTFFERAFPFIIFRGREVPAAVRYLGRVLPMAIMATLIIYCLRGTTFAEPSAWVPQIAASAATAGLHLWKRNSMLSIFGGTIICMILTHLI